MSDTREQVLELTVVVAARPTTIFRQFTDPDRFARWMGGAMGRAELEPREGGALRVEFPGAGEEPGAVVLGEVLALEPDHRFVFTWGYQGDPDLPPGSTRVEITLEPGPHHTVVRLRHSGLPDELRPQHRGGWRIYTAFLASRAADEDLETARRQAASDWFAAWKETDPDRRRELLERGTAPEVSFRDAFAALSGREDLASHIAASQAHSKGIRLEPDGDPTGCHEAIHFPWRAVSEDGEVVARGTNVGKLSLDGRFREVYGFRLEA